MPHIKLNETLYGMRALMEYSPDTAQPLNMLAEILLRDDRNTLSRGERELIASYVSYLNDCFFCQNAHGGIAQHYLQCDYNFIEQINTDFQKTSISDKLKALLIIARSVQFGGKNVTSEQIETAKNSGANDKEIHDTVLISAFFCMCNRYVDGLNTNAIKDRQYYVERGKMRAEEGYLNFDLYK